MNNQLSTFKDIHLFAVLWRGCLDEFCCGGFDSFDALASVIEHPLEELLLLQLRLHHLHTTNGMKIKPSNESINEPINE